jgi:hypothetical protein
MQGKVHCSAATSSYPFTLEFQRLRLRELPSTRESLKPAGSPQRRGITSHLRSAQKAAPMEAAVRSRAPRCLPWVISLCHTDRMK